MMKKLAAAAALLVAGASPAYAVTFSVVPGSAAAFAAPSGATTINFNGGLPTGVSLTGGQIVSGDLSGQYAEPGFSDRSQYLAVLGGQTATLTATGIFSNVSLFLGSTDAFNVIRVLSTAGAVLGSFTGDQLVSNANGDQDIARTNVRVTFANQAGEAAIGGLQFVSGQNSLETDNIVFGAASAVPEPAAWAMMVVGIGLMGGALRRRKKVTARVSYAV